MSIVAISRQTRLKRTWLTVMVVSETIPSYKDPSISFAEIGIPSKAAMPTSRMSASTCPRWMCPSSSATNRMRRVQLGAIEKRYDTVRIAV